MKESKNRNQNRKFCHHF